MLSPDVKEQAAKWLKVGGIGAQTGNCHPRSPSPMNRTPHLMSLGRPQHPEACPASGGVSLRCPPTLAPLPSVLFRPYSFPCNIPSPLCILFFPWVSLKALVNLGHRDTAPSLVPQSSVKQVS